MPKRNNQKSNKNTIVIAIVVIIAFITIALVTQTKLQSLATQHQLSYAAEGSVLDTSEGNSLAIFANNEQINIAKQRIANGDEPTATSFNFLKQRAQKALTDNKTYSVQTNGGGEQLSGADDMNAARTAANYARDLSLVYRITGDSAYAEKALRILRYTFLETKTKMAPTFSTARGAELLYMGRVSPTFLYTVDLLKHYSGWQAGELDKIYTWAKAQGYFAMEELCSSRRVEGSASYRRILIMSAAGALTGDTTLLDVAFSKTEPKKCNDTAQTSIPHKDGFKRLVDTRLSPEGWVLSGIDRHKYNNETFYYSVENLDILLHIAEIGKQNNVDLYNYASPDGRSIRKTLDHHIPYVTGTKKWPYYHTMNHWSMTSVPNSYMLGNQVLQQSSYNQVEAAYQKNFGKYLNGAALAEGFIDGIGDARLLHSFEISYTSPATPQPTSVITPKPTTVNTTKPAATSTPKPTITPTAKPVSGSGSWIEAESYASTGGQNKGVVISSGFIRSFDVGDWVRYTNVDFGTNKNEIELVMSVRPGKSTFEVRLDSEKGKRLATINATETSSDNKALVPKTFKYPITATSGKRALYLVAINRFGVADIDKFKLNNK